MEGKIPSIQGPILLCLDLEAGCATLARYAAAYAARCGQPLHVLYVMSKALGEEAQEAALQRLQQLVAQTLAEVVVEAVVLRRGLPEEVIVPYAGEHCVDQIILGRRQRSTKHHTYVNSTTSVVISLTHSPVLIVPLNVVEAGPQWLTFFPFGCQVHRIPMT